VTSVARLCEALTRAPAAVMPASASASASGDVDVREWLHEGALDVFAAMLGKNKVGGEVGDEDEDEDEVTNGDGEHAMVASSREQLISELRTRHSGDPRYGFLQAWHPLAGWFRFAIGAALWIEQEVRRLEIEKSLELSTPDVSSSSSSPHAAGSPGRETVGTAGDAANALSI